MGLTYRWLFQEGEHVMGTEHDEVLWEVDPRGRVLCINTSFLEMLRC